MLRFLDDVYGARIVRADLDGDEIAFFVGCPAGISLRWMHLPHTASDYIEILATEYAARAAVESWVAGLDIAPWEPTEAPSTD
jgi:hypothetical protein